MAGLLLENLKFAVKELKLVPSRGGCFELKVDGQRIYSKLDTGEFPDESAILKMLKKK